MHTYRFTIVLSGVDEMTEDIAEALFEAGCDDGSPASGLGIAWVGFDRDAISLEAAVASALANVRAAGQTVARVQLNDDELSQLKIAK